MGEQRAGVSSSGLLRARARFDYPVLITSERRIVDGRNRRNAAAFLGISVPCRIVDASEVAEVAMSSLANRRHLPKSALAYLLAPMLKPAVAEAKARQMANLKSGKAPERSLSERSGKTVESLADELGLGRTFLFQALDLHKRFSESPKLREQFEHRIISGELGLGGAIQAIAGKLATEGKNKVTSSPKNLIEETLKSLNTRWQYWEKIKQPEREELTAKVVVSAVSWPREVCAATAAAWRKEGIIG